MIITLVNANFSSNNIGTLSTWTISRSLGTGATYTGPNFVDKGTALSATVTITDGYELGTAGVTVTMGGVIQEGAASVNGNVITISIASVTGIVMIKVPTINSETGEDTENPETPVNPPSGDTTTLTLHKSATGNSILDYKNVWKMFGAEALATLESQIIGVDVSAYAGQTITITAAQSVIAEANYAMFCSNLPNAYIKSLAELDGYNSFGTAADYIAESYDNLIGSFNISTVNETTNTITKTIPTNAKYLFFSNLNTKCANPTVVVGGAAPLFVNATDYGWSCLDYQTYFYLTSNATFQGYQSKVLAVDVSGLVGKTLSITATQSIIDGAYYSFFTKALPSGISSIEELNGLAYPGASDPKNYTFADADLVENFNVAVEHQTVNTITKVVPAEAKYLFVNTLDKYGSSNIQLVE